MSEYKKKPYRGKKSEKVKQYFYNRFVLKMNKKDAALKAGYAESTAHSVKGTVEGTEYFKYLCDIALPEDDLVYEHKKVIEQDDHLTAKNQALKMAYEVIGILPNKKQEEDNTPSLRLIVDHKNAKKEEE